MEDINTGVIDENPELSQDMGMASPPPAEAPTIRSSGAQWIPPSAGALRSAYDQYLGASIAANPSHFQPSPPATTPFEKLMSMRQGKGAYYDDFEFNADLHKAVKDSLIERGGNPRDPAFQKEMERLIILGNQQALQLGIRKQLDPKSVIQADPTKDVILPNGTVIRKGEKPPEVRAADFVYDKWLKSQQPIPEPKLTLQPTEALPEQDTSYKELDSFYKAMSNIPGKLGKEYRDLRKENLDIQKRERVEGEAAKTEDLKNNPDIIKEAERIARYDMAPPRTGSGMGKDVKARNQAVMSVVDDIHASQGTKYDAKIFDTRKSIQKEYFSPTGQAFQNAMAINTTIDHLKDLKNASEALDNKSWQTVNKVKNWMAEEFDDPAITNFRQKANTVASEIAKVFKGGRASPTTEEMKEWLKNFNENMGPEQLMGAIRTGVLLLSKRQNELQEAYEAGMGNKDYRVLSDKAVKSLKDMNISPEEVEADFDQSRPVLGQMSKRSTSKSSKPVEMITPNGKRISIRPDAVEEAIKRGAKYAK